MSTRPMGEYAFVVIERQHSASLAIEYPDPATAEDALKNSPFIDGLCEEDCLDAYVQEDDGIFWPADVEHVLPPQEGTIPPLEYVIPPCEDPTGHLPGSDHRAQECPTYHENGD